MMIDIAWMLPIALLAFGVGGVCGLGALALAASRRMQERDEEIARLREQNARLRRGR